MNTLAHGATDSPEVTLSAQDAKDWTDRDEVERLFNLWRDAIDSGDDVEAEAAEARLANHMRLCGPHRHVGHLQWGSFHRHIPSAGVNGLFHLRIEWDTPPGKVIARDCREWCDAASAASHARKLARQWADLVSRLAIDGEGDESEAKQLEAELSGVLRSHLSGRAIRVKGTRMRDPIAVFVNEATPIGRVTVIPFVSKNAQCC